MTGLAEALFWLGAALPGATVVLLWLYVRRRRRVARALADPWLVRHLAPQDLSAVPWTRMVAVALAALLLGLALMDPGGVREADPARAVAPPVVLVLDASLSMLAADVTPNRLEQLRSAARGLVQALPEHPVGIVIFAGRAYALAPPTPDRGAIELYLEALDPSLVTQSGSSLAAAVRQGVSLLRTHGRSGDGSLVMITDGDAAEARDSVRLALTLAREEGVKVHVIGVGTAAGAPVQVPGSRGPTAGEPEPASPPVSRLREDVLREIAAATNGTYSSATAAEMAGLVERLGKGGDAEHVPVSPTTRFGWFVAAALLLLMAEAALSHGAPTRSR